MWIFFLILSFLFTSLGNYVDEKLVETDSEKDDKHKRAGSIILISTLATILPAIVISIFLQKTSGFAFTSHPKESLVSFISAFPMVFVWIAYFYLMQKYSVSKIAPLFVLSTLWLLLFDILTNNQSVNITNFFGILVLVFGSYIFDSGSFKIKTPTKLLLIMLPITLLFSFSLMLIDFSQEKIGLWESAALHNLGIFFIGLLFFVFIKKYRDGFTKRIKTHGKEFLKLSFFNEIFFQISFMSTFIVIAFAPISAYATAFAGFQSLLLIGLLYFFPINKQKSNLNKIQIFAVFVLSFGVLLITLS